MKSELLKWLLVLASSQPCYCLHRGWLLVLGIRIRPQKGPSKMGFLWSNCSCCSLVQKNPMFSIRIARDRGDLQKQKLSMMIASSFRVVVAYAVGLRKREPLLILHRLPPSLLADFGRIRTHTQYGDPWSCGLLMSAEGTGMKLLWSSRSTVPVTLGKFRSSSSLPCRCGTIFILWRRTVAEERDDRASSDFNEGRRPKSLGVFLVDWLIR